MVAQYLENQKRHDSAQGLNRKLSAKKLRCKKKKFEKKSGPRVFTANFELLNDAFYEDFKIFWRLGWKLLKFPKLRNY